MDEQQLKKQKDLAEKRVNTALAALRRLGNLSGPAYVFSDEEVKDMFDAIDQERQTQERRFGGTFRFQREPSDENGNVTASGGPVGDDSTTGQGDAG